MSPAIEGDLSLAYNSSIQSGTGRMTCPAFRIYSREFNVSHREPAILVLKDGTVFRGTSIGAAGMSAGEVVFNTAMTGYQEILTDPSYCRQIVTLTYPHIGNTGTNPEDVESDKVAAAGLVIRDLPQVASNWRSTQDLASYLREQKVVAIADIDTRKLTRILREKGAQDGCVMAGKVDEKAALKSARAFPGLAGMDLAKVVSCVQALRVDRIDLEARTRLRPAGRAEVACGRLRLRHQAQHSAHAGGARLPAHGDTRAKPGAGRACAETGRRIFCRTAPAIRNPAIMRSARSANSSPPASRCSAFVSATNCWGWRAAPGR